MRTTTVTADDVRAVLDGVPDPEMPAVSVAEVATRSTSARALPGVTEVEVRFTTDVVWGPERIRESAHAKLAELGIAPPGSGQVLLQIGSRSAAGTRSALRDAGVRCPLCGATDTVQDSPFGPTPCRSAHWCTACRNPFEAIKP